ncbi:hypothetical protein TNCV_3495491 [Trichonephila clavipes]|nr:hypothetical protein TNCV_3495491 [Trichonephila clavipes]
MLHDVLGYRKLPARKMPRNLTVNHKECEESVRNLSTNLLRRLSGEYKFAFISNQLQKEEVLGPVDLRDVIYSKTRLRTPSKDQSSRRPPHRKKCTRTTNCFINRHPNTGRTFTRGLVSSRTPRRRRLKDIWTFGPAIDASVWSDATHEETGLQWNGTRSSLVTNPDSILAVVTIVFVCGDSVVNASILPLLYSDTPLPQLV